MIPFEWFAGGLLLAFAAGWLIRKGVDTAEAARKCRTCDGFCERCRAAGAV